MRTKIHLLVGFCLLSSLYGLTQAPTDKPKLPDNASETWYSDASNYIRNYEYAFRPDEHKGYRVTNSANGIYFQMTGHGYSVSAMTDTKNEQPWFAEFSLNAIGRNGSMLPFVASNQFESSSGKLLQHFEGVKVEYVNNEKGLRQNFYINDRPAGEGMLRVTMDISTTLQISVINQSMLTGHKAGDNKTVLEYADLKVWDATNRILPAHMELNKSGKELSLVVDDNNAVYPVTIDPLTRNPEWTTSADGILPGLLNNLALQVNTLYGLTVASIGDINHDGSDDVAVSAPGMANVVTGSGALLGVGAVFIFLGNATTGLAGIPSKVLQPTSSVAGALFGYSVAAGNISPDGFSDVLVSAPLDRYTTTASVFGGTISASVTAGKVYYYRSEDIFGSANPTPTLNLRLQGTTYWSDGILGLLASNISTRPLFGLSLSVTDDLNGDGHDDVIVGAPAYVSASLLQVKSGGAYVFYSDNLGTTTPVDLDLPTPTILGLVTLPLANLNGLLFGFSVDGIGDFNNDTHPDVVVGAPAGADLSSLGGIFSGQVLGGSAYVYYGTGAGLSNTIGATLHGAPSGLLSNAANLFGYRVRGVRNAAGAHNGNILISAPVGGVLSNIIGGLRLKAGQVHVFKKRTLAFTSPVQSNQILSSPRNTSVFALLTGQNLNVSMLYGAGTDNVSDINCDGNADIMIGEPLSTNVPLIGANVTGGAAYVYLGKPDGTYQATPVWNVTTSVSPLLGVNATSLVGFSVAGIGHTSGPLNKVRAIIGGPTNTLDFGSGLLNLGNTVGTLMNFTFDNGGLGKSYVWEMNLCGLAVLPTNLLSFNGFSVGKTVQLNWATGTELQVNRYEIERSANGVDFASVGIVFAKGGQENSYDFPDMRPLTPTNYYRLRIVDTDGKIAYSNVISIRFNEKLPALLTVTPNPAYENIRVKFNGFAKGVYSMRIYSTSGQLIDAREVKINMNDQTEEIKRNKSMTAGIYWISVLDSDGKKFGTVRLLLGQQ